jgi:hypothetical protein
MPLSCVATPAHQKLSTSAHNYPCSPSPRISYGQGQARRGESREQTFYTIQERVGGQKVTAQKVSERSVDLRWQVCMDLISALAQLRGFSLRAPSSPIPGQQARFPPVPSSRPSLCSLIRQAVTVPSALFAALLWIMYSKERLTEFRFARVPLPSDQGPSSVTLLLEEWSSSDGKDRPLYMGPTYLLNEDLNVGKVSLLAWMLAAELRHPLLQLLGRVHENRPSRR